MPRLAKPDPKPSAPRHEDPTLLAELKLLWREFGCAICGRALDMAPPGGFDVELHHLDSHRHDYPWLIVGLCGELTEKKCHHLVTTNVYRIERNERGFLVWRDMRAGSNLAQSLRFIPKYSQIPPLGALDGDRAPIAVSAEANGDLHSASPDPPGEETPSTAAVDEPVVTGLTAGDTPDVAGDGADGFLEPPPVAPLPVPVAVDTPHPDDPPAVRAEQIRARVTTSKRLLMEAAILLRAAYERGDYTALGTDWPSYYSSLGLERSNVSKMLAAARTLGDQWSELEPATREHVSIEQLYQASLLVTRARWSPEEAIDAAVMHPTTHLIALRTGDEPAARCKCTCSECGAEVWHSRGAA